MQHTFGPWIHELVEDTNLFCVTHNEGGYINTIARIEPQSIRNGKGTTEANARLIAAAPDLLEACKSARKLIANAVAFINDQTPDTPQDEISALYVTLTDAIAKAEGTP